MGAFINHSFLYCSLFSTIFSTVELNRIKSILSFFALSFIIGSISDNTLKKSHFMRGQWGIK
jgi:hypothetical protein